MFDRTVTITPRTVDGVDDRGTEQIVDGEPFELSALRSLKVADEATDQRDEQDRTYRYLIEARHPDSGELVEISGFDRLTDNGETFEIIGTPTYVEQRRRGRVHHVELDAHRSGPGSDRPPT